MLIPSGKYIFNMGVPFAKEFVFSASPFINVRCRSKEDKAASSPLYACIPNVDAIELALNV